MENPDKAEGRKMLVTEGSPSETVLEPSPSTNTNTNTQIHILIHKYRYRYQYKNMHYTARC